MRAVADARETVVELGVRGETYRLLLPHGRGRFELERLVRDEYRFWISRWERYGMGVYQGTRVVTSMRGVGEEIPAGVLEAIEAALEYVQEGPAQGPVRGHA